MESRIILSQADFSANNIGRYVELLDLTKKVLAKQTQYNTDSEEGIALNTFLQNLTDDGFLGGDNPLLHQLIIPGLASNHDELLYDIAHTDTDGYPVNAMAQTELEAADNLKVYRPVIDANNRIIAIRRYSSYADMGSDVAAAKNRANIDNITFRTQNSVNNSDQNDFSFIGYIHKKNSSTSSVIVSYLQNVSDTLKVNPLSVVCTSGSTEVVIHSFTSEIEQSFIINYNKANARFEGIVDNTSFIGDTMNPIKYSTVVTWNTLWIGGFNYTTNTEMSLIALGDFIPVEKQSALKGYIDTFLTAIHVI